jgi:hypothetical protein
MRVIFVKGVPSLKQEDRVNHQERHLTAGPCGPNFRINVATTTNCVSIRVPVRPGRVHVFRDCVSGDDALDELCV